MMVPGVKAKQKVYVFAASYAQRSLWFLDQLAPGSSFYNLHIGLRFDSPLDVGALHQSINEIVRRHEVLRTAFKAVGSEPMQVVLPELEVPLEVTDLRELDEAEREDEALRLADEEAARPFDLTRWPLLRTRLLKLGDQDHILLLTMHHIVCDYWSLDVFRRRAVAAVRRVPQRRCLAARRAPHPVRRLRGVGAYVARRAGRIGVPRLLEDAAGGRADVATADRPDAAGEPTSKAPTTTSRSRRRCTTHWSS